MRLRHTASAGLLAGALALSLVAAETAPAATGAGTASTRLLGAEVRVTGPLATPTARLLDVVSSATTEGTPVASTSVVPIAVGEDQVGATGASSSGDTSASSDGGGFGDLAGPLGLVAQPIETSATASADRALATVGAATGQLSALLGAIDLDLDTTGVSSLATRDGAAATQGMTVSGLDLSLGDLGLGADVLGQLGLDQVLALLAALPDLLPADLADATEIFASLEDLDAALATLGTTAAPLQDAIDQLTVAQTALPGVEDLDGLLADLQALVGETDPTVLLNGLTALAGTADALGCTLTGLPADLIGLLDPLGTLTGILDDAIACVTAALDAEAAALIDQGVAVPTDGTQLLDALTGIIDQLTAALPDELAPVLAVLDQVTALVDDILAQLGGLDGLLDLLPDLLADAAGLELLSVGAFDVGTTAVAGATTADSSAVVLCEAVDVSVLGEGFTTPDCSEALDQLPDVTGAIGDAVDQLTGVLNTLPLGDLVQVGELRADVFTDVVEQVSEADGVVTATAGFNLLDLQVPSVTLDPSQVTSVLDGLGLPDVLGTVEGLLGDLEGGLTTLDGLGVAGVDTLLTQVGDALAAAGAPDGLTGTVDTITTTIDGLAIGDLGTLTESVSTPGLELLIDPVSTATFAAAAGGGTAEPAPTPAPDPAPSLPSTGGGFALLGVLALAGAGAVRRRR